MIESLLDFGDWGFFAVRLVVGIIFIYHGLPKVKKSSEMSAGMGMPSAFVMGLGIMEIFSGLGVLTGIYVQISSILLAFVMCGAIYFKIFKWGVSFASHNSTGWEFDLILLAANILIFTTGGGSIVLF